MKDNHRDKIATKLAETTAKLTQGAIMANGSHNMAEDLYLAVVAMAGLVETGGAIVGLRSENHLQEMKDEDRDKLGANDLMAACTAQAMMFVAVLSAICIRKCDGEHVGIDYGPVTIVEAMEAYEKITGEKPDKYQQHQDGQGRQEIRCGTQ